jgi:hypothetical protein
MEGSESKKSHLSGGSKATDDLKDGCEFPMRLCSQSSISMKGDGDGDGVSSMGEDTGAGLDMKNMNMEHQALPMETWVSASSRALMYSDKFWGLDFSTIHIELMRRIF